MRRIPYPRPGEILLQEFLKPMGITQYRLAKEIGVPRRRIGEIVAGTRGVTADTGPRLSRFFGLSSGVLSLWVLVLAAWLWRVGSGRGRYAGIAA